MKTFKRFAPHFFLFTALYLALGVVYPTKVFYINMIVMSYINVVLFYINDLCMTAIMALRNLL